MRTGMTTSMMMLTLIAGTASAEPPALEPQRYASIDEMIEDQGDFSAENDTFKIIKKKQLYIQLSPQLFPDDQEETIKTEINRSIIYGIYRTFIHTSQEKVSIISMPLEISPITHKKRFLESPKVELSTSRKCALEAVQNIIKAKSLDDLVTPTKAGEIQLDSWSKAFEPVYFGTSGQEQLLATLRECH